MRNTEALWGLSQRWDSRAELVTASGQLLASTDHVDPAARFRILSGTVTEDLNAAVTGECSVAVAFPWEDGVHPLVPTGLGDPFDPNSGSRLKVWAGPADGHLVQLGVFDLATFDVTAGPTGTTGQAKGYTLERAIRRAGFRAVTSYPAATLVTDILDDLVSEVIEGLVVLGDDSAQTTGPLSFAPGDDRLGKLEELAASVNINTRFDREGRFTRYRHPSLLEAGGAWQFTLDRLVGNQTRALSDEDVFNGAIVYAEPMDQDVDPTHAEIWLTSPVHPLYFDPDEPGASKVGPVPQVVTRSKAESYDQAYSEAKALLALNSSGHDRVGGRCAPWPDLETGHMAYIDFPAAGIYGFYRLHRLVHSLTGEATSFTAERLYT
jgi:hypothetical protein